MSSRFFTNHGDQTLLKKFQGVFGSNPDIEWFDGLVGLLNTPEGASPTRAAWSRP